MQLKKLQLFGFKTFAEKTEIDIDSGLTAIVGPNGSGKSNLVDALLWVLGEQNPRLLRGNSAQDVIFSGTDKRKPLGMAEVRLTIDNSDKSLPLDFAEVTVTRRIYRSGESQYLLNNAPCRLKDIVELFLDTGMGKGAYAFVSQSEIDAVLSAKPEDRRELFEEAAGIKKYRVKKREALRKLEVAETNLNRVQDILHELEAQRAPMERQAELAKRFVLLQERLKEIEVGLLVAELQTADYELYASKGEKDTDQERLLEIDAEIAKLERASEGMGERLAQAESEMDNARNAYQAALSNLERADSQLNLLAERAQSSLRTGIQIEQDLVVLAERIEELINQTTADDSDREETVSKKSQADIEWERERAELVALETAVQEALRQAEAQQAERLRATQERARQETAFKVAQERLHQSQARIVTIDAETEQNEQALATTNARVEATHQEVEALKQERDRVGGERTDCEAKRRNVLQEQATAQATFEGTRRSYAEQKSRLSTLTELQQNHEGFYQGVRAVLTAHQKGDIQGHYRAVVDLLTVPEPYRVAVEVALGGSLQDVVTQTEEEAKRGIGWLKQNRGGRATFLPLPLLRPAPSLNAKAVQGYSGVEGVASELVSADSQYAPVIALLLGRVLIMQDMDSAITVSKRLNGGWSKIVTLEGELLTPGGALTGGSLQGRGAHLVGRKGEMDDLATRLPCTQSEIDHLAQLLAEQKAHVAELDSTRARLQQTESELQAQIAGTGSRLQAVQQEQNRLLKAQDEHLQAKLLLAAQEETLKKEIEARQQVIATGETEESDAEDSFASLTAETRELASRRDSCRGRVVHLEVERGRLNTVQEGLTRSLQADRANLENLRHQQDQKRSHRALAETQRTQTLEEREKLLKQRTTLEKVLSDCEGELNRWKEERQQLLNANFDLNSRVKECSNRRNAVTKSLHDAELRIARLEVQATQAAERLLNEYSITREEAIAYPDNTTIDRNTAMEVGRLRREIRGMGQVNTGAVAEFERLTERYDFLHAQHTDLEQGRASLLSTIAEIDNSTRDVFLQVFNAVATEFDILFKRLFEGGTTRLILTKPDDLLETGIDVIAQPPGKKPQSLSLLSGGERALTATALLFAFLAVRPSPFVLLDEVDAPLDGANVAKFAELVREFSQRSQFLIITHNPTTMEATPLWYGVTMQEPGISTILAYRVPDEATATEPETSIVLA